MERKSINSIYRGSYIKKVIVTLSVIAAIYNSIKSTLHAIVATFHLILVGFQHHNDIPDLYAKQSVQKHYLGYGIYIPFNDIILSQDNSASDINLADLEFICGKGKNFVWVPFRVTIPILGEKVYEWCLTMK